MSDVVPARGLLQMTSEPVELDPDVVQRMIEIRRHLHQYPELSNGEFSTQAYVGAALEGFGIAAARPAASTGLIVDIAGMAGHSNRRLAIRADMDALPIQEETDLPFASLRAGVMHACGHDAHVAMALAAAASLYRKRHLFRGTVRFVFQPAEEAEPLGGRRIVEEGWIDDVDGVLALHVDPYLDTGELAVGAGTCTLACDIFDIVVAGRAAHAARPHEGIDAIMVGAAIVGELQKIVARGTDPGAAVVVSVTGIEGGGAYNILADRVMMKGTVRTDTQANRALAHRRIQAIVENLARAHGAEASLHITQGEPPVVNDPAMAGLVARAAESCAGTARQLPGWSVADDFGFYAERRPAAYCRLGVRHGASYPLHHPKFTIDESAMALGARVLVAASLLFLNDGAPA
jgi:amidohydrolase